ncbi:Rod shape-determining protein RodA [hydrothermal vent metagenome]|jgi:rod shape determining protein RodA|uniref:Rod shape-determining protein RodA n=1 Tax=hydrothermal vent metagenome TaxID=652676 RepID=A0A3B0S5X7_9ZZZZ
MALTAARSGSTYLQRERALKPDVILVLSFLLLAAISIVMVYTASAPRARSLGEPESAEAIKQAVFAVVGVVAFIVASVIEPRTIRLSAPSVYLASLVTLVVVQFTRVHDGAQRWIDLGPVQFQPSEAAKLAVILALAALLASETGKVLSPTRIAQALALVAVPAVLIFMQPDLGTMLVFGFFTVVMLFVAGTTGRQLGFLMFAAVGGVVVMVQTNLLQAYQVRRLTAFLDEAGSSLDAVYNQQQSEIAIGAGGLFGTGLLNGAQTNLNFVPVQASDFIFTAIGEQLGFIGASLILALYALIIWRILMIALVARSQFSQLVAVGFAAMLMFHVFVNVGMTVKVMPVTGLPLPWMSAGGTAFVVMSTGLGIVHGIWMRRSPVPGERSIL